MKSWHKSGPLLLEAANQLLRKGKLAPSMCHILITLIPKRSVSSLNVTNLRPILLINTSLRLICLVISRRLMPLADVLIGKDQRGFLPTRHIDDNIAQVRNLAELIREATSTRQTNVSFGSRSNYEHYVIDHLNKLAIVMIDLTKAFDRISHDYIARILSKNGFGPNVTRAIMTVLTSQHARLYINRQQSQSFPLQVGTMQGNPLSPFLFLLCVEPFLRRLKFGLHGIKITIPHEIVLTVTSVAFADDIACFIHTETDITTLNEAITEFELVSNSLVNKRKTVMYDFDEHENGSTHPILGFTMKHYDHSQFTYLGFPNQDINWGHELHKVVSLLKSLAITTLPLCVRTLAINTYIFSKLYFRDLHSPMDSNALDLLDRMIKEYMPQLLALLLTTPVKYGGFGLIDMRLQLLGRRAKVVHELLIDSELWNYLIFRHKCQMFILEHCSLSLDETGITTYLWWQLFLPGLLQFKHPRNNTPTTSRTHTTFCRPSSRLKDSTFFNAREREYFSAWFHIVKPSCQLNTKHLPTHYTNQEFIDGIFTPITLAELQSKFRKYGTDIFRSYSRKTKERLGKPHSNIQLTGLVLDPPIRTFWEKMRAPSYNWYHHNDNIRLFHLGVLFPELPIPHRPQSCALCLEDVYHRSSLITRVDHVYFQCPISAQIWTHFDLPLHLRTADQVIYQYDPTPSSPLDFNQLDKYIFVVRQIHKIRRMQWRARPQATLPSFDANLLKSWIYVYGHQHH